VRIALAQLNTVVGDIAGNTRMVRDALTRAEDEGAALLLVPELAVCGYPPEDLLLRPGFAARTREAVDEIAAASSGTVAVVGFVDWDHDAYNAVAVVGGGEVHAVYRKRFLPNYGVFDEARYFQSGTERLLVDVAGARIGIVICEDIWYSSPVASDLAAAHLDLICCVSASPYHQGKAASRERMLATRAADAGAALAFCNLVGGQDELVFDGTSALFDAEGNVTARLASFDEDFAVAALDLEATRRRRLRAPLARRITDAPPSAVHVDVPAEVVAPRGAMPAHVIPRPEPLDELWRALVVGIRDYVDKNRFPSVLLGLSGGIDSAVVATLAVDALGPDRVRGVAMPSVFSSSESLGDAQALAANLGIGLDVIEIAPVVTAFESALAPSFGDAPRDATEENLQARTRGTLLMALSNKFGGLVLATGNKSEIAVGYSTLYGDMVGGFAPIRDVLKTTVYALARWRNEAGETIPEHSITRPPSAELRPGQEDTDSLPPYDVLDALLRAYVEDDVDVDELEGNPEFADIARAVVSLVDRAEYKRRQGPIGIKITPRAFGKDRRMPITNRSS